MYISNTQKTKMYNDYKRGHSISLISIQYKCSRDDVAEVIEEKAEAEQQKRKLIRQLIFSMPCNGCRWKPCVGAPCCYRKRIDGYE